MSLTDKQYYQLAVSISKAISIIETPVKEKHVRATIIGTFHSQGGQAFWSIAIKQQLQEHRIVAWKFCHVLHKVLREGHGLCIQHSLRHRGMMLDLGKLWGHLKEGYGRLIQLYCKLLVTKIDFHTRNPRFPGSLIVTPEELDSIGGNDINIYFQLSVEMFDYMDDILALQHGIFGSLDACRANSMTSSGQCRLAPLVPCIQDSNQLYDFSVKILFKLHSALPPDTLSGHRDRFLKQFKELKAFYNNTKQLQYFIHLITIPSLPERPPNFLVQSELRTYVPPVVILPEEEPQEEITTTTLVDTSYASDLVTTTPTSSSNSSIPELPDLIRERDALISHLQGEVSRLQATIQKLLFDHQTEKEKLQEEILNLQTQVAIKESELVSEQEAKRELEDKMIIATASAPQMEHKLYQAEERAKITEEKFQKLKTLYTETRDQHVQLLRQKAEVDKQLVAVTKAKAEIEQVRDSIQARLNHLIDQQSSKELLQESQQEIIELRHQISNLQTQNSELEESYNKLIVAKEDIETDLKQQNDKIQREATQIKLELETKVAELALEKNKIQEKSQQSSSEKETEISELKTTYDNLYEQFREFQQLTEQRNVEQQNEISDLQLKCENVESEKVALLAKVDWLQSEKGIIEGELIDIVSQREELDFRLKESMEICEQIKQTVQEEQQVHMEELTNMFDSLVSGSAEVLNNALQEIENPALSAVVCTADYFKSISESTIHTIENMIIEYNKFKIDQKCIVSCSKEIVLCCHLLGNILINGKTTCNTSPDIEFGERLVEEIKQFGQTSITMLESLNQSDNDNTEALSKTVIEKLRYINGLVETMGSPGQSSEVLGDMVEDELACMDKAIEEAAQKIEEMLSNSRAADSGIKLEVNGKILDACTNLMAAIRLLVQKARTLQAEIVATGKGTASPKEFYKRNHQWTQGLISAAKSVALGANLLVTSADKVVTGQGKLEHLMVASQEIAASTAQLVVASRVKAQRSSNNLSALGQASKGVTQATGAVLATAKACAQMVEESEDLDVSNLTLHQAKRLEMDSQVRVIELEHLLQVERQRLSSLRRKHYQLAGDGEG